MSFAIARGLMGNNVFAGAIPRPTSVPAPTPSATGVKVATSHRDAVIVALSGGASGAWVPAPSAAKEQTWEDGSTRVNVGFDDLGEAKSRVAVSHERLPDADTAEEMKSWWRERLTGLKSQLEG